MKKLLLPAALVAAGVTFGAAGWVATSQPAHAQEVLAISRQGRVDGRTVGEVVLRKKVALRLAGGSGSMSPIERADLVASRLNRLDSEKALRPTDVRVTNQSGLVTLMVRQTSIVSVSAEDARLARKSASEVGDDWMDGVMDALGSSRDRDDEPKAKPGAKAEADDYSPELKKKLVPILTIGSSINVGVAQVQGAEVDVNKCKAVAQIETDYKDVARIKILVPVQSEGIIKNIDRVPGVSVSAMADYALKR